jgi:integrase
VRSKRCSFSCPACETSRIVGWSRGHLRIHRNVATLVDPPAQRSSEVATALTLEEATAVLDTARGLRNEAR